MRQAAFPFEVLDVKDALVGAPHVYELDLMNRRGPGISCKYAALWAARDFTCSLVIMMLRLLVQSI